MNPLMELLSEGAISSSQYEQSYAFLDHARMGLAHDVYASGTRHRRARLARGLGLEVPGLDDHPLGELESPPDVRSLVSEVAAGF